MKRFSGIDPGIALLRERAPSEELDYGFVMDCLKEKRGVKPGILAFDYQEANIITLISGY